MTDPKPSLNLGEDRVEKIDRDRGQTNRSEWGRDAVDLMLAVSPVFDEFDEDFDVEEAKTAVREHLDNQRTLSSSFGQSDDSSEAGS